MDPRRPRPSLPLLATLGLALAGLLVAGAAALLRGPAPTSAPATDRPRTEVPAAAAGYAVWGHDAAGRPLRWDACTPIAFVLNEVDAPPDAEADLREALAMLADASGLTLVLTGRTDERPRVDRPLVDRDGTGWRWRPVLVAWARPGEGGLPLTSLDRGVALPVAVRDGDRQAYVTGQVVLNSARQDLVPGFGDRSDATGATLVHELAHVLGLDHVEDPEELMWVEPGEGAVVLGPGDRAGLQAIGAASGCRPAPDPTTGRGLTIDR